MINLRYDFESCKSFVETSEHKNEYLFYVAGLYWIHISTFVLQPFEYRSMLERVMIGEERERKISEFDLFHPTILENLVKDTSNIEEEKVDLDV